MPALQVREFPDDLYEELRAYAARNHRSIAQQTIACVENEIARDKAASAGSGNVVDFIPPNVSEATARARVVDPFKWLHGVSSDPEDVIAARKAKREKLRDEIAEFHKQYDLPETSCEEIVAMIHESRNERTEQIISNVDRYFNSSEGELK